MHHCGFLICVDVTQFACNLVDSFGNIVVALGSHIGFRNLSTVPGNASWWFPKVWRGCTFASQRCWLCQERRQGGVPTKVRCYMICDMNLLRENQRINLPFRGVLGTTARPPGFAWRRSPPVGGGWRRLLCGVCSAKHREVDGKEKATGWRDMGADSFCSSLLGDWN